VTLLHWAAINNRIEIVKYVLYDHQYFLYWSLKSGNTGFSVWTNKSVLMATLGYFLYWSLKSENTGFSVWTNKSVLMATLGSTVLSLLILKRWKDWI
jgi:nitrate/nitrite transporter NarK